MATNDYEAARLENIRANEALLKQLNLGINGKASSTIRRKPAEPRKKVKREPRPPKEPTVATRASSRIAGIELAKEDPVEAEKRRREEEEAAEEERQRLKRARHENRYLNALSRTGLNLPEEQTDALKAALRDLTDREWPKPAIAQAIESELRTAADKKLTPSKRGKTKAKAAHTELREAFEGLTLRRLEKIVPERVYSMAVHPTPLKDLVFVGDKAGYLGIWDALAPLPDEDGDEDEEGGGHKIKTDWSVRAHTRGTISALRFSPTSGHTIFTSSYDCTARQIDFETGHSQMVVDADAIAAQEEGDGETLLSGFDITRSGHELWVSDNRGGILHRDLRQPIKKTRRWKIDEKKVGCISLNPVNELHLVTAHLNRDLRVWDVRKLGKCDPSSVVEDINEAACLGVYTHGKACSSAYFDPSGHHILSTSYDDCVRVWNFDTTSLPGGAPEDESYDPDVIEAHNNQTGRYVTPFKAQWSPNASVEPHFTIGNMKHSIDVYAGDGTLISRLYDADVITATPAVTASHPSILERAYGATASGKVSIYCPPEEEAEPDIEEDVEGIKKENR